ncbi:MAG TPA: holo-ACP synthase [Thermoanaerobaculia bacterium]|nr:holo-ACP synthase [Thermoanaerobaculia bacterium]
MSRVLGIGLDVVDLARFARAHARHGKRLEERLAGEGEIRPLTGTARTAHLAGLFAAKEAVLKALGTGWAEGLGLRQVVVEHAPSGAPRVVLTGAARHRAEALGGDRVHLSITHDRDLAAAVAILEGDRG